MKRHRSKDVETLINVFAKVKGAAVHKESLNTPFGLTAVLFPFPFQRMSAISPASRIQLLSF